MHTLKNINAWKQGWFSVVLRTETSPICFISCFVLKCTERYGVWIEKSLSARQAENTRLIGFSVRCIDLAAFLSNMFETIRPSVWVELCFFEAGPLFVWIWPCEKKAENLIRQGQKSLRSINPSRNLWPGWARLHQKRMLKPIHQLDYTGWESARMKFTSVI